MTTKTAPTHQNLDTKKMVSTLNMTYMERNVERGEVIHLDPMSPNNDRLVGLRYFRDPTGMPLETCDSCGKEFDGTNFKLAHQRTYHAQRPSILVSSDGKSGGVISDGKAHPSKQETPEIDDRHFESRLAV